MDDPYETLGVGKDASDADIKKAYRRRASAAHPDREGGDAETMAKLNRALAVLEDPQRRAEYDRTGRADLPPAHQEARDSLMRAFQTLLDKDVANILEEVRRAVGVHTHNLHTTKAQAQQRRARLVKRTGKVRVKQGENLMQMVIDQQIRGIDQQIAQIERGLEVDRIAGDMLKAYEQDEVEVEMPSGWSATVSFKGIRP